MQVRDELRTGYDEGRGGYSVREQQQAGGAVGGGVGAEEGGVLTRPGFSEDRDSRDARARRFSGGPGESGAVGGGARVFVHASCRPRTHAGGGGGYRPRGSFGSGGGSPYPRPAYGGGWGDRPPPRDSYGASGGGDGGAGSKRRRCVSCVGAPRPRHATPFRAPTPCHRRADYAEPEDAERHRPFRAGGEYGGAAADDAGRAADAPAAEGEGGRRRRGGAGGGGADGDEGLPEVDEFGREVRRE